LVNINRKEKKKTRRIKFEERKLRVKKKNKRKGKRIGENKFIG